MSSFETGGLGLGVKEESLHKVDAQYDAEEAVVFDHGKESEAALEHVIEGIADFRIRAHHCGIGGSEFESGMVGQTDEVALSLDGAREVALGDDVGRRHIFVHDDEGRELVHVHLIDGVTDGGMFRQGWDMSVEYLSEDHRAVV